MSFIYPRTTILPLVGLTIALSCIFSLSLSAEERWVEGQHYQVITPPVAVGKSDDVVVTEFFWYGCGHCYTFEPMLTAWGKQLPDGMTPCGCMRKHFILPKYLA